MCFYRFTARFSAGAEVLMYCLLRDDYGMPLEWSLERHIRLDNPDQSHNSVGLVALQI